MGDFKKLSVWNKAHQLTLDLYRVTAQFPSEERFALASQIRRAASSIGANLAEGSGRRRDGEFGRFLSIAIGSASELEYHLLLAHDLGYVDKATYVRNETALREIGRMLAALAHRVASA